MPFVDTEAQLPIGKVLSYCTTANGTFVTIFGTTDITPPEREVGKAEYTNDSSPGGVKQYKPALTEPGTVKASYKYQITEFAAIETLFQARTVLYWKLATPDGKVRSWQGFMIKHNEGELGLDGIPEIDIEIQVNGIVTSTIPGGGS